MSTRKHGINVQYLYERTRVPLPVTGKERRRKGKISIGPRMKYGHANHNSLCRHDSVTLEGGWVIKKHKYTTGGHHFSPTEDVWLIGSDGMCVLIAARKYETWFLDPLCLNIQTVGSRYEANLCEYSVSIHGQYKIHGIRDASSTSSCRLLHF